MYVGNLHFSVTEEKLQEIFTKAGTVTSATLIKDHYSGRSKGFAFVEMSNQVELEEAIRIFNEYELNGRRLKVSIARPPEKYGKYGQRRGGGQSNRKRGRSRNRDWRDNKRRY